MSLPVRPLPVVQSWDCHGCSNCCREYQISVTAEERQRIEAQGWGNDPDLGGLRLFVRTGPPWARHYRLNQRPDGACIFLSSAGRCRIHERFGAAAKPFACRLYPFVLSPAGDHWRVGLRYTCPAAAASQGKPLTEFQGELASFTTELERRSGVPAAEIKPPPLQPSQPVAWPDLLRFVQALLALLRNREDRFAHRMRKCLALASLCRQARFDQVKGGRLVEFLNLVGMSLADEVPAEPEAVAPSWVSRILFRQALALYPRKDHGPDRSRVRGRLGLVAAAWRFARGHGPVPRLHAWIPETTFEKAEQPAGPLSAAAEEVLERYYAVKVSSLQFCGAAYFGFPFWEGFEALALTLPVIFWLRRVLRDLPPEEAVVRAIGMVDRNYGFNRLLGMRRQRLGLKILTRQGELDKLITWYSR
jgi:lysine-N-methylase